MSMYASSLLLIQLFTLLEIESKYTYHELLYVSIRCVLINIHSSVVNNVFINIYHFNSKKAFKLNGENWNFHPHTQK